MGGVVVVIGVEWVRGVGEERANDEVTITKG